MKRIGVVVDMVHGVMAAHLDEDESISGQTILETIYADNFEDARNKVESVILEYKDQFPDFSIDDVDIIEIVDPDTVKTYAVIVETDLNIEGLKVDSGEAILMYVYGSNMDEAISSLKESVLYGELKERNLSYTLKKISND
jgi:hypothetical protein